jgi:hypothetical protein
MHLRLPLGIAGILLGFFGVFRLLTQVPPSALVILALWLVVALVIHDGILSPVVVGAGWAVARVVPPRARRYLQGALIMAALVTVIAIPMIYRQDSQPRSKSMLLQSFGANLTLLIGIIAGLSLLAYAVRVARDQSGQRPSAAGAPPDDNASPTEVEGDLTGQ